MSGWYGSARLRRGTTHFCQKKGVRKNLLIFQLTQLFVTLIPPEVGLHDIAQTREAKSSSTEVPLHARHDLTTGENMLFLLVFGDGLDHELRGCETIVLHN